MKCSICKEQIKGDVVTDSEGLQKVVFEKGHNAYPVNNGRCCDNCNWRVVIPARMSTNFLMLTNSTYGLLGHSSAEEITKKGQEVLKEFLNKRKNEIRRNNKQI